MANSVDLDEVAHYEPPHQDPPYLQIQLLLSLVLKDLNTEMHIPHLIWYRHFITRAKQKEEIQGRPIEDCLFTQNALNLKFCDLLLLSF